MRRCLKEPIPELEFAADSLESAAESILRDNRQDASRYLVVADVPAIMEYAIQIVGKMSPEVHRQVRTPTCLPKHERHGARMPTATVQRSIFQRDGWRCRFCGIRVVSSKARKVFIQLFPDETHWLSREFERHTALYAICASLDHVVPHGRGGRNETDNFVTTCYCCQFGRGQWTLEEMELLDPRDFAPPIDEWDGLTRLEGKRYLEGAVKVSGVISGMPSTSTGLSQVQSKPGSPP